jgi:hypothetical protein
MHGSAFERLNSERGSSIVRWQPFLAKAKLIGAAGYPDAGREEDERQDSHFLWECRKILYSSSKFHFTFELL